MFPRRIPNYVIASCKRALDADTFHWLGGKQQVMDLRTEILYKVPKPADG